MIPLKPELGLEKHLLLQRGSHDRVQAALIQAQEDSERSGLMPSIALSEVLQTLSNEAACLTNARGIIEWHNRAFQHLTGTDKSIV